MLRFFFIITFTIISLLELYSQGGVRTVIRGTIRDSITKSTLPMVTLQLKGENFLRLTNAYGAFDINTTSQVDSLTVTYLGYREQTIPIKRGKTNNLKLALVPTNYKLEAAVVSARRTRYKKRGNPAVELVDKLIANIEKQDARNLYNHFDYQRYETIKLYFDNIPVIKDKSLKFLNDYVDTSSFTGNRVLPLVFKEKLFNTRVSRVRKEEIVSMKRSTGIDERASQENIDNLMKIAFEEVNIFDATVRFVGRNFVSPLSRIATSYYKYYLVPDTTIYQGVRCVELQFFPFNRESLGFRGNMLVQADSSYAIRRVELNLPSDINLNYIYGLSVVQKFDSGVRGERILTEDSLRYTLRVVENQKEGIFVTRNNLYLNHSFRDQEPVGDFADNVVIIPDNIDDFRPPQIKAQGDVVGQIAENLRKVPLFRIAEIGGLILEQGYIETGKKGIIDIGPINTFLSNNALEHIKPQFGIVTTPHLNKRVFFEGNVAYGFGDHKWKYMAALEYCFKDKSNSIREFPNHSLRFEIGYRTHKFGKPVDNFYYENILSFIQRSRDSTLTYLRIAELKYTQEFKNDFSFSIAARNYTQSQTPIFTFSDDPRRMRQLRVSELALKLRYSPGQKIYETKVQRRIVEKYSPIFELNHTMGFDNVYGGEHKHNLTEFKFSKRLDLSLFGFADIRIRTGAQWESVPYMLLPIPNTNQSFIINNNAYNLMRPLEFIWDRYAATEIVWYMNGLIFNRLPIIKKLRLRETISFKGIYATLTDKNNPLKNSSLIPLPTGTQPIGKQPYIEIGFGVDNILKILRVEYVQRFSYTQQNTGKNWALLFALHFQL